MKQSCNCVSYTKFVVKCPPYSSFDILFWKSAVFYQNLIVKVAKTQVQVEKSQKIIHFSIVRFWFVDMFTRSMLSRSNINLFWQLVRTYLIQLLRCIHRYTNFQRATWGWKYFNLLSSYFASNNFVLECCLKIVIKVLYIK